MSEKYNVVLASRVDGMLLKHIQFLARVSLPAAKNFRDEYASVISRLEENPFQFPVETDLNLPSDDYRRAIFAKRYKAVFKISENIVYLDAVVDCRQENKNIIL